MLIGYTRVSTSRQEQSLDTQRDVLVAVGCDPARIYSDTIGGTKWSRPGLDQALDFARPGDTLVVTRLDRLGRSLVEVVTTIADLAERDINVRVLEPALDTGRPADKVIINVMAALAEWERDILVRRTREGVAHAKANGRSGGRPPKLTTDQEAKAVKLIESGDTISSVAEAFHVSRATISRVLKRHREAA